MPPRLDPVLFKGYRLSNVYGRLDAEAAAEVVGLWLAAGVLTETEARRRCEEVVFTIHDASNALVGVNTVYVADFATPGQPYYFYRTFIRDADRGVGGLPRAALRLALDYLRDHPRSPHPAGLIIVTENPKLMRPGAMAILTDLGFERLGRTPRGQDIWRILFASIPPRSALPET